MFPIEVENLTKVYGTRAVVDRVTFSVPQGHVFGLLGPNGAGKTTIIKLLTGLIRPSGGRVCVMGNDLARHPLQAKAALGHVYSGMAFYPHLSALENLTFFGRLYRLKRSVLRQRLVETLHFVGLWDERKKRVGAYSQGMRQRLGIARAILHEPRVLLFDEATSGIDVQGVNAIRELVYHLRTLDKTILIASHQLGEIELLSDSIGLLKAGRLVSVGTPEGIKASLRGVLRKYVVRIPRPLDDFGVAVANHWFVKDSNVVIAGEDIGSALVARFGAEAVQTVDATLEEVFLWMLGDAQASGETTPSRGSR